MTSKASFPPLMMATKTLAQAETTETTKSSSPSSPSRGVATNHPEEEGVGKPPKMTFYDEMIGKKLILIV